MLLSENWHDLDVLTQEHTVPLDIPGQYDASLYTQDHKAFIQFFAESVANAAHHGWLL